MAMDGLREGGGVFGIFGFGDMANFWYGISVLTLNCGFSVLCLARFAGFLQFRLWLSVFVNSDGGFSHFSVQCICGFSGFAKKVTRCSRA